MIYGEVEKKKVSFNIVKVSRSYAKITVGQIR